jgi:hypothetical protein
VHAPAEDECDVTKDSFHEYAEYVFDQFPQNHMNILLRDFITNLGREDIFKPTIYSENLHRTINANKVGIVNFAMLENLLDKSKMFLYRNTYTYT